MLGRAAGLRASIPSRSTWGLSRLAYAGLTAAFVFFVGAGSLISVSAQSLPGDVLYPAKQASEKFSLNLAANPTAQRELKERFLDRRTDEIRRLIAQGRTEEVVFRGTVTAIEDDRWVVDDIVVLIPNDLDVPDELSRGVKLEITGTVQPEGWVEAGRVTVKVYKLDGEVLRIGTDTWLIGDVEISITGLSLIENGVQVGDRVLALVSLEENEGVTALAIIKGINVEDVKEEQGIHFDDGSPFDDFDEDDPIHEDESDGDDALEDGGEEGSESDSSDDDEGDKGDEAEQGNDEDGPEDEDEPEEEDPEEEPSA